MQNKTVKLFSASMLGISVFLSGCAQEAPAAEPEVKQTAEPEADSGTASLLTPGTYEATVSSVGGPLTVAVTVSGDRIEKVEVKEFHDTKGISDPVAERLPEMIVENQSANVDGVSGATLSSMFFRNAVKDALSQAGEDLSAFQEKAAYQAPAQSDMETDIVIVGAGLSGLSAALTAASKGYSVVLLEELAYVGGNAIPSDQYSVNTPDTWGNVLDELNEEGMNVRFEDFFGGAMYRMMPIEKTDTSIMNAISLQMKEAAEKKGAVVLTETPATGLIIENGEVKGVIAKPLNQDEFRITAKATLLANGGFQGNKAMVEQYLPYAKGAMTIGPSKGAGQVYSWLEDFDVATRDMDYELAMFYSINPANGHHAVWGVYDINFIDDNGDLITDDHNYNSGSMKTYEAIGGSTFHTVWSQKDVDKAADDPAIMEEFLRSGTVTAYPSLSELCAAAGLPNLEATLTGLGYTEEDTYYIAPAKAGIYGTMGGVAVDEQFRIITNSGDVIPGVFAAGETIGRNYGGSLGGATVSGVDAANGIDSVLSAQ